jgi:hypothetical protein
MARLNEILVGRFGRSLQKVFGIKGEAPVATLAPEIMPVWTMYNGVENRYLEQWERFIMFTFQNGGAAQNAAVRFRNPAGSNVVAVIEKMMDSAVGSAAAQNEQVWLSNVNTDFTTLTVMTNTRLDLRTRPQPTCILSTQVNLAAGVGSQVSAYGIVPNTNYDFIVDENQEITVLPGGSIDIRNLTVNQSVAVTWIWRERFLEEAERT